jgi:hypothetical protein
LTDRHFILAERGQAQAQCFVALVAAARGANPAQPITWRVIDRARFVAYASSCRNFPVYEGVST